MEFPRTLTADHDTRAGRMLAAGDVRVTVKMVKNGEHITYRFKCFADNRERQYDPESSKNWVRCPLALATHVFIEVPTPDDDGWADKVGTFYPRTGRFYADNNADALRVRHACHAAMWLNGDEKDNSLLEYREESRCGACGRALTDPVSIERGIGPECYGKQTGSQHQVKNDPLQQHLEERANTEFDEEQKREERQEELARQQRNPSEPFALACDLLDQMSINELQRLAATAETAAKMKGKAAAESRGGLRR